VRPRGSILVVWILAVDLVLKLFVKLFVKLVVKLYVSKFLTDDEIRSKHYFIYSLTCTDRLLYAELPKQS
jgi:hypothetical protein